MSILLLGKATQYESEYNPTLLFPIARQKNREALNINAATLPFFGVDIWHAYEMSWLNKKGKPCVAIGRFTFPCRSPYLIESKSFKLYLNSFNNTCFENEMAVIATLQRDLSAAVQDRVDVALFKLSTFSNEYHPAFTGTCLDDLDITCHEYEVNSCYLKTSDEIVSETLYSHLLKSNCLVTNQPDWGSIQIQYTGAKIDPAGLLQYLVSFRNHNEFHEQCVERIYMDIWRLGTPHALTIRAGYTRRGGLDISPVRTSSPHALLQSARCPRQ